MRVNATAVGDFNRIRVEPVTGSIGAEISNIDLRDFDDEIIAEIQQAWLDHKVLFFRDQELTQANNMWRTAARMGRARGAPVRAQRQRAS